jgi:hypothetical protein
MDQCSRARHPTGHPLLLTNRRGHGLKQGLDKRTRDNQRSPVGGSDTRILLQTDRTQPHEGYPWNAADGAREAGVGVGAVGGAVHRRGQLGSDAPLPTSGRYVGRPRPWVPLVN